MKLIHTADIRLDRCYVDQHLPAHVGRANRKHLRKCFLAILDHAQNVAADGVLIAGNLFERDRVERDTINFIRSACEKIAPIPVYITPGNLDPIGGDSPYETTIWPENVHIFTGVKWEKISCGDGAIVGFARHEAEGEARIEMNFEDDLLAPCTVVMAAAPLTDADAGDGPASVTLDLSHATHPCLAYVALGQHPQSLDVTRPGGAIAWCSGAPASGGFADSGPHQILEVTLDPSSSAATIVSPVTIATNRFLEMTVDCTDCASGQALIDVIRPRIVESAGCEYVRVFLEGALLPEIYDEMASVRESLIEDLVYLDIVDRCFVAEDFAALAEQKTSLGAFLARINLEIDDAPDAARRDALCRSRDLALCAYRGQHLPIRAAHGD